MKIFIILACLLISSNCYAENLPESKVIPAIIGEAGQSYAERLAIACAIRNRGTLRGVYGKAKNISERDYQEGAMAWHEALEHDTVGGADHWLSDWDLKHAKPKLTAFRFKMRQTVYIGNTHFYKEIKK